MRSSIETTTALTALAPGGIEACSTHRAMTFVDGQSRGQFSIAFSVMFLLLIDLKSPSAITRRSAKQVKLTRI